MELSAAVRLMYNQQIIQISYSTALAVLYDICMIYIACSELSHALADLYTRWFSLSELFIG